MPKVRIPKEMIIEAAFEITKNYGMEFVTADAVAKKLNCSKIPIYWVFENMDSLKDVVLAKAKKKYTDCLLCKIPGVPDVSAIGLNYVRFSRDYPHLFKLIFFNDREENKSIVEHSLDDNKPYVVELIQQAYGIEDTHRAEDIYIKLGIFCNGIAAMIISKTSKFSDADVYRLLIEVTEKLVRE
ncbi:MAG: TetR/AcrR family transcriptional regulator [Firmicutes bacterium]|nr:TetR/AcrR family transcriptional regulator [Bacillota bacterium]